MKERMQKKAGICVCFILAIILSSVFTSVYDSQNYEKAHTASSVIAPANESPLEEYRTERQQLRQMQKSQLNDIIYGTDTDQDIIDMAQKQILEILKMEELELLLEGMLKMRGFEDAIITVHGDSVNAILQKENLSEQETMVILELIIRETGLDSENVKIIPIN